MSDFLRDSIGIRSRFTIPAARPGFSCGRCGDDSEPADCPDRMSFEDHGLCCLGQCLACQHRIDQGETE